MKLLFGLIAMVTVAGCATVPSPQIQALQEQIDRTAPVCSGTQECEAKWEAAQLWVVHHSAYKIQTATNVLIETFNPGEDSPEIAVRVTKEPQGGGKYRLMVAVWCNNIFGCNPDPYKSALDFNKAINAITP